MLILIVIACNCCTFNDKNDNKNDIILMMMMMTMTTTTIIIIVWIVKTKVVPVGRRSMLRKDFMEGVELTPGCPKVLEIQKISLLGTAHILHKVLG